MKHFLTLRGLMADIWHYAIQSVFLELRTTQNVYNWCQDKAIKITDGFLDLALCPKYRIWRENIVFELVVWSIWQGLSSPHKKVARSNTPCQKRSQILMYWKWIVAKICAAKSPVLEKRLKNLENKLSPPGVKYNKELVLCI